jgi:hypothetical protein
MVSDSDFSTLAALAVPDRPLPFRRQMAVNAGSLISAEK